MPSEVADIKQFLEIARRKDASSAKIKKSSKKVHGATGKDAVQQHIKFKIRCNRFLYTLVLKDSDKADKLKQSLPPNMHVSEIGSKSKKAKKN